LQSDNFLLTFLKHPAPCLNSGFAMI